MTNIQTHRYNIIFLFFEIIFIHVDTPTSFLLCEIGLIIKTNMNEWGLVWDDW